MLRCGVQAAQAALARTAAYARTGEFPDDLDEDGAGGGGVSGGLEGELPIARVSTRLAPCHRCPLCVTLVSSLRVHAGVKQE
jgi:hypothetical protein